MSNIKYLIIPLAAFLIVSVEQSFLHQPQFLWLGFHFSFLFVFLICFFGNRNSSLLAVFFTGFLTDFYSPLPLFFFICVFLVIAFLARWLKGLFVDLTLLAFLAMFLSCFLFFKVALVAARPAELLLWANILRSMGANFALACLIFLAARFQLRGQPPQ